MTGIRPDAVARIRSRLEFIYGPRAAECLERVQRVMDRYAPQLATLRPDGMWSEQDAVLITYGDQVQQPGERSLVVLERFLAEYQLDRVINTVHLLPFYPYSSDDGFSVIDYRQVDPALGDWPDVRALGHRFKLMFDLVLNHASAESSWFRDYLAGVEPYSRYFIEADPAADWSGVTRPRSLPLLTEFITSRGSRHLWTTFSSDQIDLNYAEPALLEEMIDVTLYYVTQGARLLRLDAVAYLWKERGTNCIHLPQTHEFVKLIRDVLDAVAPGVIVLTETNVPHSENVGYFGNGDEAHMVYQFSLPPLLLDALLNSDATLLTNWLAKLAPAPPRATFFNFTASHDGIGVRPLEGLVPEERVQRLVDAVRQRGGMASTRRNADGSDSPYELNISYVDALGTPGEANPQQHARRFLASQAVMLALQGIPGIYFHSLVGSPNDREGAARSGQPRRINRRRYTYEDLERRLADASSTQGRIFRGYQRLLEVRRQQPAFHPDAAQEVLRPADPALVAFVRTSRDASQRIVVVANFSAQRKPVSDIAASGVLPRHDLLAARSDATPQILEPYQVAWFE